MRTSLGLALLVALGACGGAPDAPSWPAGTVLVVAGEPVLAEEVDEDLEAVGLIDPAWVTEHRRRLLLQNVVLPLAYGRSLDPARRADARAAAEAWRAAPGGEAGVESELRGNWDGLGFEVWLEARRLEAGQISEVVELPGRFVVLEVLARQPEADPRFERFHLRLRSFPYVDSVQRLTQDFLDERLEIVDPAWREIVPGYLKHRMQASR